MSWSTGVTQHPLLLRPPAPHKPSPLKPGLPGRGARFRPHPRPAPSPKAERRDTDDSQAAIPEVLTPSADASTDANGIPSISANAPDLPTRTHAHHANEVRARRRIAS